MTDHQHPRQPDSAPAPSRRPLHALDCTPPRRRILTVHAALMLDACIALLAVALVVVAFAIANWGALASAPNDAQADADTAASAADAIAAARAAGTARPVRVAAWVN